MIYFPKQCVQYTILVIAAGYSSDLFAQQAEPIDFGRQIQPILAKRCFACHGPDKAEGGLRLNQKESAFTKLESEKVAIVPHDLGKSELARRIRSIEDGTRMPPEGPPLPPQQVELIQRWIEQGADWKEHWAFQSPRPQQPPAVKQADWVTNPIDSFVLSKLEQHGLRPAPPAEKEALLRRVTYDLTGLPPSATEVNSFLADQSPQAFEKVVDRLLQSQRFGEHWARHWLDIVRYADTNSFERDGVKPNAWRYRDYVIRSFNDDKPYDQFIREQLAGDELPNAGPDGLIATGFYRLGLWDDEPADRQLAYYDGLDDVITTTAQGFLGLTVNCGRCHDHKIDPIPQRDYYSLLAFFRGVTPNGNPNPAVERPIFENESERLTYEAAVKSLKDQLNQLQDRVTSSENELRNELKKRDSKVTSPDMDQLEYRFYRDSWQTLPDFDSLKAETIAKLENGFFDISSATREFSFGFVFVGTLKVPEDGEYSFSVDSDDGSRLTVNGQQIILYDGIHGTGNPRHANIRLEKGRVPIRLDYFQGPTGAKDLIVKWSGPGFIDKALSESTGLTSQLPKDSNRGKEFAKLMAKFGPTVLGSQKYGEYSTALLQLDELKRKSVVSSMALCVTEAGKTPPETNLLRRGNPLSPGEAVVPAFLSVLGGGIATIPDPLPTAATSGRRTVLADWIASPENRLTGRVMVNRIWQYLFGRGIVRSPNNFGLLGDPPTHPELLDWLALDFTRGANPENDSKLNQAIGSKPWQMKRMIKLIVCSSTYRMSTHAAPGTNPSAADPLNNLIWKHDMRRLSAEEIRDSILAVDGRLNTKMYGKGVFPEISNEVKAGQSVPGAGWGESSPEEQARRSVYVHVKRSLVLPILSDFDFADTDSSCAARFATTQPTQALGMLNGKFLNQQAVEFAQRLRREAGDRVEDQVKLGFRLALSREPGQELVERGLSLIEALQSRHGLTQEKALEQFCLMTLNLNEFVYLD